jgi:hypothetical protein
MRKSLHLTTEFLPLKWPCFAVGFVGSGRAICTAPVSVSSVFDGAIEMTQDEIVKLAREAGLVRTGDKWVEPARWV